MISQNAICGECGRKYSDHYEYRDVKFCPGSAIGTFSCSPPFKAVGRMLQDRLPAIYQQLVNEWKRENGHSV